MTAAGAADFRRLRNRMVEVGDGGGDRRGGGRGRKRAHQKSPGGYLCGISARSLYPVVPGRSATILDTTDGLRPQILLNGCYV